MKHIDCTILGYVGESLSCVAFISALADLIPFKKWVVKNCHKSVQRTNGTTAPLRTGAKATYVC